MTWSAELGYTPNAGSTRSIGRRLAPLEPSGGVLVAYSAKHGTLAQDGAGANSPFATALADYLEEPGLEINFLFLAWTAMR